MTRTGGVARLDPQFERTVEEFVTRERTPPASDRNLTERLLAFAQGFNYLREQARRLDQGKAGQHCEHLNASLTIQLRTSSKSICSKWCKIGSNAQALLHYNTALPPYRDSLYELALAIERNEPVAEWVEQKKVTVNSSIRQVKSLRSSKAKRSTKNPPKLSTSIRQAFPASVVLSFDHFESAANALLPLLRSEAIKFVISAHATFRETLKTRLSAEELEKAKAHFP